MDYRQSIRDRMAELGQKQADLAVSAGIGAATLSRFFKGNQDLDVDQLHRVAKALGLKAGDLLERSAVDPMLEQLAPLVERLRPLRLEDQVRAVSALALALDAMKGWRFPSAHEYGGMANNATSVSVPSSKIQKQTIDYSDRPSTVGIREGLGQPVEEPYATATRRHGHKTGSTSSKGGRRS